VGPARAVGVELFRGPVDVIVTDKVRTVIDCLRWLPFDEALAVADSALDVSLEALADAARRSPRTGRSRVLRVLRYADSRAAKPSSLRYGRCASRQASMSSHRCRSVMSAGAM